jgi:hypothetical protein
MSVMTKLEMIKWQIYFSYWTEKNKLKNSCNGKENNNGEGQNEGDINYQFDAEVKMSAHELGKRNVSVVAEEWGVDDFKGGLEENSNIWYWWSKMQGDH